MRLFDRLRRILPSDVRVTVQAGPDSERLDWPAATVTPSLSANDLDAEMHAADVVIAHAGIGSALSALRAGKIPILVPRRGHQGEHIDDHQDQIARYLVDRGLAISGDADSLDLGQIHQALTMRATAAARARSEFHLL